MMRGKVEGFGTFCHEFSHCLGLPDFYRTDGQSSSVFTMESWSLMDYGSYTDDSFRLLAIVRWKRLIWVGLHR